MMEEEHPKSKAVPKRRQVLLADKDEKPNYDAVFGEEKPSSKFSQDTPFGKLRNPKRFGWPVWVFITLSLIAFAGTLGLTIERLVYFHEKFHPPNLTDTNCTNLTCSDWTCRSDVTFAVVLIVNLVFCLFYALDGVLRERGMEILAVPAATIVVVTYLSANYIVFIISNSVEDGIIKLVRLILAWVVGIPLCIFAIFIYSRMGTLQFDLVGGNKTRMRAYRVRSFLFMVTLFNLQLVANMLVLAWTSDGYFMSLEEKVNLPLFAFYTFVQSVIGWIGFYYEFKGFAIVFVLFFSPTLAYPVFKIINVILNFSMYINYCGWDGEAFEYIAISLLVACGLAIVAYGLILAFSVWAILNFNKGLVSRDDPPLSSIYRLIRRSVTSHSNGHERLVDSSN